jgi:HAMP domain-containing protein/CheY-like chemotaxis protein/signal transduction histidine kinase
MPVEESNKKAASVEPSTNGYQDVKLLLGTLVAVKNGDFSVRLPVEWTGLDGKIADAFNDIIELNAKMAGELERVSKVVGKEGRLTQRASLGNSSGAWAGMLESVNSLVCDLVWPTNEMARVIGAVAKGDLSQAITLEVEGRALQGDVLSTAKTVNAMVEQLGAFTAEVTRVAREVGSEGKLGGQAQVKGVAGTWKDLTDSVNSMAANLTAQVRNIAEVTTAVATGDLSKKITVDVRGEILQLKDTINTMVEQLRDFASEVTRVAREVGTEGKLGGQAVVPGVAGTWKDLTVNVNLMASNLTAQVRNIAEVTTAVARGDMARKITVDVKGEILELKNTINTMVDQLNSFASEVTRVAREVGTEGKLGGQAQVPGVAGTWKDLTDNVNLMANNLTAQVRNIAEVTTAVATGDLSKKITVDVRGEILQLKDTINTMVEQLRGFASEVTRVAREVGSEGKLGGQAQVPGVAGTWKDLTDNVNAMASNLTVQVRNIAEVTTAVATGDLSKKITVDVRGEILELKNTINTMVDQLNAFAAEVTRVAREVGTDGKLGGQAEVKGVAGVWKNLTDNVNAMAGNLTAQVRNIAEVTTAVATGDLSKKITVDVRGEILELKNTINAMVDQLNAFAAEVTRVAKEVGTDGKLGGQAEVKGVAGTWKNLTDNVNAMASNLTAQVRDIARVSTAIANGDLGQKITVDVKGEILELKETINRMVDQLNAFAAEVTRVTKEVGTDGKLGGQAEVKGVAGTWKSLTDSVNASANNLTAQVRDIARVSTAIANGDLGQKITVDVKGETLQLKETINRMVDQLNAFAAEVTRVAKEVGTDGKLGGQAEVKGVAGIWEDLTDNVNVMAANLTDQVRGIAKVVTAVATGYLKQKLTVQAKGEIASLADTINSMIDTLAIFADQVTSVARQVGVEGKLGGQANVPGAAGTWKDLTDNVNQLAANLTTQVRAIADVATAVTKGDLTRSIQVEALGEVAKLKDNINEMIRNLRETTGRNTEQDWLKTNLAKFTRMLQGQRDLQTVARTLLSELAPLVAAQHGVFYIMDTQESTQRLRLLSSYGFKERRNMATEWKVGEGLVGQCAYEKQSITLTNVPGDYVQITSGLGQASPLNIMVLPVLFEGEVKAVFELGSFSRFSEIHQTFLEQLTESIGIVLNTIGANTRTEGLLTQSQGLAKKLQSQQEELQQTNEELVEKARLLDEQKNEVEHKNREVELAKGALEEKAEQLARTSKYKSEFLANMSHELRTPLNSLLILAQQLATNPEGNLTPQQANYGRTIHAAGTDLLHLINDILDLSKIESGTVTVEAGEEFFADFRDQLDRTFRHMAADKGLSFTIELAPNLPRSLRTDGKRLQQVLKNLLSNAFKFTERGGVDLRVGVVTSGWSPDHHILTRAQAVIAFSVSDTGIGVSADKQKIIFDAFQQADGTTSRKYGGTGLGLAISREIATLLGGELRLVGSLAGQGSTFTLFLPQFYTPPKPDMPRPASPPTRFSPAEPASGPASTRPSLDPRPGGGTAVEVLSPRGKPAPAVISDDREGIESGDRVLLIVEDDPKFAQILLDMAREKGFKGIVTIRGETALSLAHRLHPDAITLDILLLDDIDGWTVLDRLKMNPTTRHIPVHIISVEEARDIGLKRGAFAFLEKPVSKEALEESLVRLREFIQRPQRKLLVVEDQVEERQRIVDMIAHDDVCITAVSSASEALAALKAESFDCAALALRLPGTSGFELLEQIHHDPRLGEMPVIVYTARDLTKEEEAQLNKLAQRVLVKGSHSPERLLAETALFLHRVAANLPEAKRRILEQLYQSDTALVGKRVLIVDDDIRNIFALTTVLERHQMEVFSAENGRAAINLLQKTPGIDVVLMDIMMPEMDGYDTIRAIRKIDKFKVLRIVALTAKAMQGDREKCIEAGASDYVSKPVNTDHLLSMLRVWLYR